MTTEKLYQLTLERFKPLRTFAVVLSITSTEQFLISPSNSGNQTIYVCHLRLSNLVKVRVTLYFFLVSSASYTTNHSVDKMKLFIEQEVLTGCKKMRKSNRYLPLVMNTPFT